MNLKHWICLVCFVFSINAWGLPEGFVYLDEAVPGIQIDLKYAGEDNFMGRPVTNLAISSPLAPWFHQSTYRLVSPISLRRYPTDNSTQVW